MPRGILLGSTVHPFESPSFLWFQPGGVQSPARRWKGWLETSISISSTGPCWSKSGVANCVFEKRRFGIELWPSLQASCWAGEQLLFHTTPQRSFVPTSFVPHRSWAPLTRDVHRCVSTARSRTVIDRRVLGECCAWRHICSMSFRKRCHMTVHATWVSCRMKNGWWLYESSEW